MVLPVLSLPSKPYMTLPFSKKRLAVSLAAVSKPPPLFLKSRINDSIPACSNSLRAASTWLVNVSLKEEIAK